MRDICRELREDNPLISTFSTHLSSDDGSMLEYVSGGVVVAVLRVQ